MRTEQKTKEKATEFSSWETVRAGKDRVREKSERPREHHILRPSQQLSQLQ